MRAVERREKILDMLIREKRAVSGRELSETFGVSRQIIVQDIAILRAEDHEITSTNLGYVLRTAPRRSRVFKLIHSDEEVAAEMNLIVDNGGAVEDVFVYHRIYGVISADLSVRSRADVKKFLGELASGKSSMIKNVTSGYHYHTVTAETEETLDEIQKQLGELGFLAKLQDYEPVDFWKEKKESGK